MAENYSTVRILILLATTLAINIFVHIKFVLIKMSKINLKNCNFLKAPSGGHFLESKVIPILILELVKSLNHPNQPSGSRFMARILTLRIWRPMKKYKRKNAVNLEPFGRLGWFKDLTNSKSKLGSLLVQRSDLQMALSKSWKFFRFSDLFLTFLLIRILYLQKY